jgi:crotonobetainyl-CoA:carnitine CoA-transferase CaiB-like acyl-CoA transferase
MASPLEGLLVIELASVLAGPSVGQFCAELGAEVIKVENPASGGDVTRSWKLPEEDPAGDCPAYFTAVNWGKQSVAMDLRQPGGRDVLARLARQADVAITSYRPGEAAKLGADAETLRRDNPRLIVLQVTGYGADDPRPGYDAVIQAEAGFMHMNGVPAGPPTKLPVALMDVLAAGQLKEALLVALLARERTGEGATITVSLLQAAVAALANQASNFLTAGHVPQRTGSDHPNIAPYGTVFDTASGEPIVLAVGTDRQFAALCDVLGLERMAQAPTFATNQKRVRNRPFLHEMLKDAIASRDRDELLTALEERGVPAGAVNDMAQVFAQPPAGQMVLRDEEAGLAAVRTIAFQIDGAPPLALTVPPHFGEHTHHVLRARLAMEDGEVEALIASGAVR